MNFNLADRVVFVAGASRGIGRAIAETMLEEGAKVVVTGRNAGSLEESCRELEAKASGRVLAVPGDLTQKVHVAKAIELALRHFGRIDHLVANLGSGTGQRGWEASDEDWQRLFEVNFFASVRLAQLALPYLIANNNGSSIVFIASITGLESTAAPLAYSAAKAALLNYSKNLARQLGAKNVRVNSIAPGNILFKGGTWDLRATNQPSEVAAMLKTEVPQERFGSPEQIGSLAAYLCSSKADFVTGGCYVIDGGQTRSV